MKNNKRKVSILTVCLLLTVLIAVGSTIAYIFTSTGPVTNTFTPVTPETIIDEDFQEIKENVSIRNSGKVDSYIRVKIAITWQDKNNNVYYKEPVLGEDYTITYTSDTNWVQGNDGFWYYKKFVPAGQSTSVLISEAKWLKKCENEAYPLDIEILSQAIQSTPDEAVAVWNNDKVTVTGNSGILTVVNK